MCVCACVYITLSVCIVYECVSSHVLYDICVPKSSFSFKVTYSNSPNLQPNNNTLVDYTRRHIPPHSWIGPIGFIGITGLCWILYLYICLFRRQCQPRSLFCEMPSSRCLGFTEIQHDKERLLVCFPRAWPIIHRNTQPIDQSWNAGRRGACVCSVFSPSLSGTGKPEAGIICPSSVSTRNIHRWPVPSGSLNPYIGRTDSDGSEHSSVPYVNEQGAWVIHGSHNPFLIHSRRISRTLFWI